MTNKELVKTTLKELQKDEIYYKATCTKTTIIICLGFENAPTNYKKYIKSEAEQLMWLFRNLDPQLKTKTQYGYRYNEIRINNEVA
jgi:hypothetical protein